MMNNTNKQYGYGIVKEATLELAEAGLDLKGRSESEIVETFLALHGMKTEDEYLQSKMGKNDELKNAALIRAALADIGKEKDVSQMDISEVVKEYMEKKGYKSVEDFEKKTLKRGAYYSPFASSGATVTHEPASATLFNQGAEKKEEE